MRRLALILVVLGVLGGLAGAGAAGGSDSATVVAIFDNASGVFPGNELRVAGVPVGLVQDVELTDDLKARVEMSVSSRFVPFHEDATCEVLSESLIGERFVQCDPGTPDRPELAAPAEGEPPTVPVQQTTAPVDLDLVFALQLPIRTPVTAALPFGSLRLPYRERLAIVIDELGAGLAAEGDNLNAIIRRGAPTLRNVAEVLRILDRQREDLRGAIADTDHILAAVARDPEHISGFIRQAAAVTERTAAHQAELEETTRLLPGLLREAQPALTDLGALAERGTPVVANLRRSAPDLTSLVNDLGRPLADAGVPALDSLDRLAATGREALNAAAPTVASLRTTTRRLRPIVPTLQALLDSLVSSGGTEGLLRLVYNGALATNRFDATSHILPVLGFMGNCSQYNSGDEIPACSARFDGAAATSEPPAQPRHQGGRNPAPGAGRPARRPDGSAPPAGGPGGAQGLPELPLPDVPDLGGLLGGDHRKPHGHRDRPIRHILDFIFGP